MRIGSESSIPRDLRILFESGTLGPLTDGQLLERFATGPGPVSEAAFEALVDRHGAMVLRVCRSVGLDAHAADDAFQATFLVLARRSRQLWVRNSLAPWLHQVALRTARCARSAAARRARHERAAARPEAVEATPTNPRDAEREHLLHRAIDALPASYREPVVLCDLEGRPHEEAARHLGCPVGTVKSRLSRGRARLRSRLAARGLAPSAGGLLLASNDGVAASLSVSSHVTARAVLSAINARAGTALIPASVAALAKGAARMMIRDQAWTLALPSFVLAAAIGGGALAWEAQDRDGPTPAGAAPAQAAGAPAQTLTGQPPQGASDATPASDGSRPRVVEHGRLAAARTAPVVNVIPGSTTLLTVVPEGTYVTKGDFVCELDASAFRDQLAAQEIVRNQAALELEQGKKTLELAELGVSEYLEGIFPAEEAILKGQAELAALEHDHATRRLAKLQGVNPPDEPAIDATMLDVARAGAAARETELKLRLLREFTKPRRVKELQAETEKARAALIASEFAYQIETKKKDDLESRIREARLTAPIDGTVIYASSTGPRGVESAPHLQEGVQVRERQSLLTIADSRGPLIVEVPVRESIIDRIRPGQSARVTVGAKAFPGVVETVAPLPDPTAFFSGGRKVYTVRVALGPLAPGQRPGVPRQPAEVEFLIDDPAASAPDKP